MLAVEVGARGFVAESFVSGIKKLGFGGRKLKLLVEKVYYVICKPLSVECNCAIVQSKYQLTW